MKTLIFLTGLALLSGCGIKIDHSILNKNQKVKTVLDAHISKSDIPGIQYIVMDSDRVIFEYAGGWADIENKIPMQTDTTMMAYSMTKTITAAAVLQLVEKGKLDLDDSVDMYVRNNPYGKDVRVRHLLSQTSGIPNPIPLRWAHLVQKHEEFNEDAVLALVLEKNPKLRFEPGKKYAYSNISYWLLGKIIENVSAQSHPIYMREHILKPLHLTENEMDYTIPDRANHAKGYLAKYSFMNLLKDFLIDKELIGEYEGKWLHINDHYLDGPAFGGLIGSARSFRRFLQDQLGEQSVLFKQESKNLFYAQQKNNTGERVEMTLGWHISDLKGTTYFFKEGGGGGYHCEMRIYPTRGIATIIMVNRTNFNSKKYLNILDNEFLEN
jgi:CubicO group peptidase (beta-lactamase class C family)